MHCQRTAEIGATGTSLRPDTIADLQSDPLPKLRIKQTIESVGRMTSSQRYWIFRLALRFTVFDMHA